MSEDLESKPVAVAALADEASDRARLIICENHLLLNQLLEVNLAKDFVIQMLGNHVKDLELLVTELKRIRDSSKRTRIDDREVGVGNGGDCLRAFWLFCLLRSVR